MKYTADEVIQFVEEENVKFIRLAFCDIYGRQKNISIMPGELRRAFSDGMAFDASAIAGFGGAVRSDYFCGRTPPHLPGFPGGRKTAGWYGCSVTSQGRTAGCLRPTPVIF